MRSKLPRHVGPSIRPTVLLALLLASPLVHGASRVEVSAARVDGPGWQARGVTASLDVHGAVTLSAHAMQGAALPFPIKSLHAQCRMSPAASAPLPACAGGRVKAELGAASRIDAAFAGAFEDARTWSLQLSDLDALLTWSHASGRFASEALRVAGRAKLRRRGTQLDVDADLRLPAGQAYVEPIFNDFGQQPLTLALRARADLDAGRLAIERLAAKQVKVGRANGAGTLHWRDLPRSRLALDLEDVQLAGAVETWIKPRFAGTRLADLAGAGMARGRLELHGSAPAAFDLRLQGAQIGGEKLGLTLSGIDGELRWAQDRRVASRLQVGAVQVRKLAVGALVIALSAQARDLRLTEPLRAPIAGGALVVQRLAIERAGAADMAAEFEASIEPIDLATLCRALGWPEFAGTLSGRLPGLRLKERELVLDGALTANAFKGDISLTNLRVLDPFGAVPRVAADIRLRGLDLETLTGAFSFGRIEGRLDGDVTGLRLLGWEPVAMDARLYTPPDDKSRHRISQRAIDSISAIGGGPSGVLSRGFLRFFDDFAYERIGWRCVLENGICRMGGIKPAPKGDGYVLVEGHLLPRIDVIGYARRVNWNTFMRQVREARYSEASVGEKQPAPP